MGSMASAAANDVSIGLGLKDDPERGRPQYRGGDGLTDYQRRTAATVERERKRNNPSALYKEDDRPRQPAPVRAAPAVNYNIAPVGAAPTIPDPNAIGETEQALLDAQSRGRSSTIATSSRGLLSDEDDTRKKRSLMGGLIS